MKKEYVELNCSVVRFDNEDIVTASTLSTASINRDGDLADLAYDIFFK